MTILLNDDVLDSERHLLTSDIIKREYARCVANKYEKKILEELPDNFGDQFPVEDRKLSLDAFSRKYGWVK